MNQEDSSFQQKIIDYARSFGVEISEAQSKFLSLRCSSIEGAVDYFLGNPSVFTEVLPLPKAVTDELAQVPTAPIFHFARDSVLSESTAAVSEDSNTTLAELLSRCGFSDAQVSFAVHRCSTMESAVQLLTDQQNDSGELLMNCSICMDQHPISEMITLSCSPIAHRQGRECFAMYCASQITNGIIDIVCPEEKCGTPVTIFELQASLSADMFARYEFFSTRAFCEDQKLRRCPKCNEWYVDVTDILESEIIWKSIKCEKCAHQFCAKCGERPHKGQRDQDIDCAQFSEWLRQNDGSDQLFDSFMRAERIYPCPQCGMAGALIEGGCKFLYCRCKANFCALCGVQLSESKHYSHFKDAPGCTGPFGEGCKGVTDK